MCRLHVVTYPCNHSLFIGFRPCAPGAHPPTCTSRDGKVCFWPCETWPLERPETCPASKSGRPCVRYPLHPTAFGEYCFIENISIVDAVAEAPIWLFNVQGKKVGTKIRPWRLCEYIVGYYRARDPDAIRIMRDRIRRTQASPESIANRTTEDDEFDVDERMLETEAGNPIPPSSAAIGVVDGAVLGNESTGEDQSLVTKSES